MQQKIPLVLFVVQLLAFSTVVPPVVVPAETVPAETQLPSPTEEDRAQQAVAVGLDLLAAGNTEGAIRVLRTTGGTSSVPALAQQAQCLAGAALAMNGEFRSTEDVAGTLNYPATGPAQAAWKQVLPECVRRLEGIAARLAPEKRAGLFYYLGIIGWDETQHIRHLREAIKLHPDFAEASYQLAIHLLGNNELDEAISIFRRVAEQRPEWAEPRNFIGMALTLSGRPAEAIRELQQAVKILPEFAAAHGQLGLALYLTGDYDNALVECGRAIRHEPEDPFHHYCAAVVLLEKNRAADAVAYARRATQLAPKHETYQVVLAAALQANGLQEEALLTMRRALAAEPRLGNDPRRLEKPHLLRGRALASARQVLQKAATAK